MTYECDHCGKGSFSSYEAMRRHQQRSKICKGIRKKAKLSEIPDIKTTIKKWGFIIDPKPKKSRQRVNKSV